MLPPHNKSRLMHRMDETLQHLEEELSGIRTGRASPALFDSITVNYYGSQTPLKQLATLSTPEPRQVTIQPWDPQTIGEIEKAILAANLGLNPTNDGKLVRVQFPPLSEDRRRDLVKLAKKLCEEGKIALRNVRRDENEAVKDLKQASTLSDDEARRAQDEIQRTTDEYVRKVDTISTRKDAEIMEQ